MVAGRFCGKTMLAVWVDIKLKCFLGLMARFSTIKAIKYE
jgi:hypothetical protein